MLQNDAVSGSAGTKPTQACQELSEPWEEARGATGVMAHPALTPRQLKYVRHCCPHLLHTQAPRQGQAAALTSCWKISEQKCTEYTSVCVNVNVEAHSGGLCGASLWCQAVFCSCRSPTLWDTLRTAAAAKETLHQVQWSCLCFFFSFYNSIVKFPNHFHLDFAWEFLTHHNWINIIYI